MWYHCRICLIQLRQRIQSLDGPAGDKLVGDPGKLWPSLYGYGGEWFRQLTNSKHPVHSVEDMKNLKLRVAGSNLLMKCYELWGCDQYELVETYTALQQGTVDGQGEPASGGD